MPSLDVAKTLRKEKKKKEEGKKLQRDLLQVEVTLIAAPPVCLSIQGRRGPQTNLDGMLL